LGVFRITTFILLSLLQSFVAGAQIGSAGIPVPLTDTTDRADVIIASEFNNENDIVDVTRNIMHPHIGKRMMTGEVKSRKLRASVVPAAGYTLQTDFAGIVGGNASFFIDTSANASTILTSLTYTSRTQIIFPFQGSFWTRKDKYNILIDWRYLYFPSSTYGLGGHTSLTDGYLVNYSAIHIHQAVLRKLRKDMYLGLGYNLDYFWDIKELDPPANIVTDFENYGYEATEFASGFTFNFLYDNRDNPINARKGNFVNIVYRPNLTIFGNTATWRSLAIDLRKYINFPAGSKNVLAFWNYDWLTLSGKTPYLMLPNTGGDPYSNTGRGYIQGRYRGDDMVYLEAEYRINLSRSGIFGAVVFANAQSFTEQVTKRFETIAPGYGGGIRLKFNKFSRTNVAIDYGFGLGGSQGLFINVGEVF
jgi:outer membrane protein assembly factor BamA